MQAAAWGFLLDLVVINKDSHPRSRTCAPVTPYSQFFQTSASAPEIPDNEACALRIATLERRLSSSSSPPPTPTSPTATRKRHAVQSTTVRDEGLSDARWPVKEAKGEWGLGDDGEGRGKVGLYKILRRVQMEGMREGRVLRCLLIGGIGERMEGVARFKFSKVPHIVT